jgi:hypothetical protein
MRDILQQPKNYYTPSKDSVVCTVLGQSVHRYASQSLRQLDRHGTSSTSSASVRSATFEETGDVCF